MIYRRYNRNVPAGYSGVAFREKETEVKRDPFKEPVKENQRVNQRGAEEVPDRYGSENSVERELYGRDFYPKTEGEKDFPPEEKKPGEGIDPENLFLWGLALTVLSGYTDGEIPVLLGLVLMLSD